MLRCLRTETDTENKILVNKNATFREGGNCRAVGEDVGFFVFKAIRRCAYY
jgi:hypothetical protein